VGEHHEAVEGEKGALYMGGLLVIRMDGGGQCTYHMVCCICLQLMDCLELIESSFGSGKTKGCRLLHQAQLSIDVSGFLRVAQSVPVLVSISQSAIIEPKSIDAHHALRFAGFVHGSAVADAQSNSATTTSSRNQAIVSGIESVELGDDQVGLRGQGVLYLRSNVCFYLSLPSPSISGPRSQSPFRSQPGTTISTHG